MCYALTEYSDTLPEASLTPPPNTVLEVLWICGVLVRVLLVVEVPPFRMTVPRSQLPDLDMSQISPGYQTGALVAGGRRSAGGRNGVDGAGSVVFQVGGCNACG